MKTLLATAVGAANLLATGAAYAANAQIVNGGQGAAWVPLLFATVVFGLVTWVLSQLASEGLEGREEQGKPEQALNRH